MHWLRRMEYYKEYRGCKMEKLKLYTVIKSNSDHSIKAGDIIWLSQNGDLNNATARGWL